MKISAAVVSRWWSRWPSVILAAAFAAVPAFGQTINVDLNSSSSSSANYSGAGLVPDDPGTVWNALNVTNSTTPSVTLASGSVKDSVGNTLPGVSVSLSAATGNISRYSTLANSTPNPAALMQDYTYNGTYTVAVSGLEPGSYRFWFYGHGDVANQAGTVTVDAANGGGTGSTANSLLGRDLVNGGEGVSHVHFDDLTVDSSGTFTFVVNNFLNGFQLQRVAADPPPPAATPAFQFDFGATAYTGTAVAADAGTTWNQLAGSAAASATVADVLAADGSPLAGVGVTVTTTGTNLKAYAADTPGNPNPLNLMRDYFFGGNFTVDVSGLAEGNYVLHVFAHGDQAAQNSTVTLDAGNGGGSGVTGNSGDDFRNLLAAGAEGNAYLTFPAAVGSEGALSFTTTGYLTGFQLVPVPAIAFTELPQGAILADGTPHTMTVAVSADDPVDFQWQFAPDGSAFSNIPGATGDTLALTASAATSGYYRVIASTIVGSITSPAVYFGTGSAQAITFAPAHNAVGIAIDQPLRLIFPGPPKLGPAGALRIHDASNGAVVASIDRSAFQSYTVDSITLVNAATQTQQGSGYFYLPIAIHGNEAWITPGTAQRLAHGKTYYVTMDAGLFFDSANQAVPAITGSNTWRFSTRDARPGTPTAAGGPAILTVAMDGGGDFATLQGALDWIPQDNTLPRTILIEPGVYREAVHIGQNRRFVTIMGTAANREDVVIHHPSPATSDSRSAGVIRVTCDDVTLRNLTLDCGVYVSQPNPAGATYPDLPAFPGRINVLLTTGKRLVCEDVVIKGGQDSAYTHSGVCYFKDCEIWGSVDFIYGAALAVFEDCDIVQVRASGGPITAPSTDAAQPHGLVFLRCRFPRALAADGFPYDVGAGTTTFMRPWRKDGATEIIDCQLDTHLSAKAWSEWGGREATCRAREHGNTMLGGGSAPTPAQRQSAGAWWLNTHDPDYDPATDTETDADVAPPGGTGNRQPVAIDPADYTLAAIFGHPYYNLGGWLPETGTPLFTDGYGSTATGGEGGTEVIVTTAADLISHATSSQPRVIRIAGTIDITGASGTYGKRIDVTSHKTIEGVDGNAGIIGNLNLGSGTRNVIIRGLHFTHPGSVLGGDGRYVDGGDGISIAGASEVHVTRCSFRDCADGTCDISHGADYVTVSWCRFSYSAAQTNHRFAMILGNSTASNYHATLHHNWFAEGCNSRMPSGSFSRGHLYNNYFSAAGNSYCTNVRVNGEFRVENSYYQGVNNPCYKEQGGRMHLSGSIFNACTGHPGGWDSTAGALTGNDDVFLPPYAYTLDEVEDVPALVMAGAGAGAAPINATVTLGSLFQIEDGAAKPASVTTDPAGLTVALTYDGSATAPVAPGSYIVAANVTASGYTGAATDTLVIEPSNTWTAWKLTRFTSEQISSGLAEPDANPDGDGLENLAEYALGANPHQFTPLPAATRDGSGLTLVFTRPQGLPEVTYHGESTDKLDTWTELPIEVIQAGDPETLRVRDPLTSGDPRRRFIRLRFETVTEP